MSHRLEPGYSLTELLVGCALALALLVATLQLFARQVQAQRAQLVEARLHQDLRAASDLILRGLRRAGHHDVADAAASPHRAIMITGSSLATSHTRDEADNGVLDERERTGFRLADGGLQAMVAGRWQALTDPAVVRIVRFDVAVAMHPAVAPADCARLVARELSLLIEAHPTADPARLRRIRTNVAVRNDDVDGSACSTSPRLRETAPS